MTHDPSQPEKNGSIFLVSSIPVFKTESGWGTSDLWARDVNVQAKIIAVTLYCPVHTPNSTKIVPLDPNIRVIDCNLPQSDGSLCASLGLATYIQIPGNFGWKDSAQARRILRLANKISRPVILGISSNRALTNLINKSKSGVLKRAMALGRYVDIRFTQRWLARRVRGVFVVGAGLIPLVRGANANLHIGIASWVASEDICITERPTRAELRICMAGRLERMKGFHVGLDAIAQLQGDPLSEVLLIGTGPEETSLRNQVRVLGLDNVTFSNPVPYPGPFLRILDDQDIVLMTNLNVEQPRLIFDAISRGCIPICPETSPYIDLGLDPRILYPVGDPLVLATRIRTLSDKDLRRGLQINLANLAKQFTIQTMHDKRAAWVESTIVSLQKIEIQRPVTTE